MKRLALQNKNTSEEYDKIFFERQKKEPDWIDIRRWKYLLKYYRGENLIDLGCLDSLIPYMARKKHSNAGIWAIDQSEKSINYLNEKYGVSGKEKLDILYEIGDIHNTRFEDSCFSYAVMGEIIEHLEEPQKAIEEAFRILKTNGVLALSTPLEETELGEVDKERHFWSFSKQDIFNLLSPYAGKIKIKILRSRWFPTYKYCFPQIICWAWKK